jgi:hypothetical protein
VQTYLTTPTRDSGGGVNQTVQEGDADLFDGDADNEGLIRFGAIAVDYDLSQDANVLAGGGFTVDFDFRRPSGFVSFWLGHDPDLVATTEGGAAFGPITSLNGADHAYTFQSDELGLGRMQVFNGGAQVDLNGDGMINDPPDSDNILNAFGDASLQHSASILVAAPNGLDNGDEVTVSVEVDGVSVPDATHTFTLSNEFGGFLGWSSNAAGSTLDNFIITALDTATTVGILGDFNGDEFVGQDDLNLVLQGWGTDAGLSDGVGTYDPQVGQEELNAVLGNWGGGSASSLEGGAVPEPASAAVLLGLTALGLRRRRA